MSHDWDKGRYSYCSTCQTEYENDARHQCPGTPQEQIESLVRQHGVNVVNSWVAGANIKISSEISAAERARREHEINQLQRQVDEGRVAQEKLDALRGKR
jgi:hypothetical protein